MTKWQKGLLVSGDWKPCRVCLEIKPLSAFKADQKKTGGRRATCKICIKAGQNGQPERKPGMKWCPECKAHKFLKEFKIFNGLAASYCHVCELARRKITWGRSPSHQPSYRALRRNKEATRVSNQARMAKIQSDPLLKKRETERQRLQMRRAYCKDPQKYIIREHISRAKRNSSIGEFTKQDIAEKFKEQKGKCYYCECDIGAAKDKRWNVEHLIPLSRGGTNFPSNIAVSCATCNFTKSTKTPWEFMPEKFSPP